MHQCLISFGANIGNSKSTVITAADLLRTGLSSGDSLALSRLYQTPPVGGPGGQESFVNAVAAIQTGQTSQEIWRLIRQVEQQLGRQRQHRWEARRIDLDILLFDDERVWTESLKIPHPRMCMRRFILLPAMDVAPQWRDPVSRMTIQELAKQVQSGPGNFLLVGGSDCERNALLQKVAEQSNAQRLALSGLGIGEIVDSMKLLDTSKRWIADCNWSDILDDQTTLRRTVSMLSPKLVVVWEPSSGSSRSQEHSDRAARLGISPTNLAATTNQLDYLGPRYLLSTNDSDWAVHELVAALEAMDCFVQPLDNS